MEPFKNKLNERTIAEFADFLCSLGADFDRVAWIRMACDGLEQLELKQRALKIECALDDVLPASWDDFSTLIRRASQQPRSHGDEEDSSADWMFWPLTHCVVRRADGRVIEALELLKCLTPRFSAEFAIRELLTLAPEDSIRHLETWLNDPCEHVRRLISEGTRPRLPWGKHLALFRSHPQFTLPLLRALRDDPSPYVRRSVANHLNDVGKDHPDVLLSVAEDWWRNASAQRRQLLRHALRHLLKSGHPRALSLLGHAAAWCGQCDFMILTPKVSEGGALKLRLDLRSHRENEQNLRIDLVIDYVKSGGKRSAKVFRWKNITLGKQQAVSLEKTVSFRPVTTRRLYPGRHEVAIQINGVCHARAEFELTVVS